MEQFKSQTHAPWLQTYDTDANFLQALDGLLLPGLLTALLADLPPAPLLLDLGCGTGRTTISLLSQPGATVLGLDASRAMLAIARERCAAHFNSLPPDGRAAAWSLEEWDIFAGPGEDEGEGEGEGKGRSKPGRCKADLIVSTLVLEHIPLPTFFAAAAGLVKPGGRLLVTNMHREMGEVSQAGFLDAQGVKVRGESFAHGVQETVEEARKCGFMLEGNVLERGVENEEEVALLGPRARKWVRGPKVWYGGVWRKG
jgi:SAM-dependent methyltransferase